MEVLSPKPHRHSRISVTEKDDSSGFAVLPDDRGDDRAVGHTAFFLFPLEPFLHPSVNAQDISAVFCHFDRVARWRCEANGLNRDRMSCFGMNWKCSEGEIEFTTNWRYRAVLWCNRPNARVDQVDRLLPNVLPDEIAGPAHETAWVYGFCHVDPGC